MEKLELNPLYVFFGVLIIALFFYHFKNNAHDKAFLLLCFIVISIYIYFTIDDKGVSKKFAATIEKIVDGTGSTLKTMANTPLISNHYQVYRYPKSLKYSYRIQEYRNIIESLDFVEKYDVEKLKQVKAYCEAFFKTHFNIMMGKYDVSLYLPELLDFKKLALNVMHQMIFVLPKTSTIIDIPDLDEFVTKRILMLSGLMTKYIKIAREYGSRQNKNFVSKYEPPYEVSEGVEDPFVI